MMKLAWPITGPITSAYGWRFRPKFGWHSGLDLACPNGSVIQAAYNGVVEAVGDWGNYGNVVILSHPALGQVWTLYAHLRSATVRKYQLVKGGERIAISDNTGWGTGPHLHFEVRIGKNKILYAKNPQLYLLRPV